MKIRIQYYGLLTEAAGKSDELIDLDRGAKLSNLTYHLRQIYPAFAEQPLIFFFNNKRLEADNILSEDAEIDCMPPFSGG